MKRLNEHDERLTQRETRSLRARLGRLARNNCARYGCDACPFAICIVEIQADRIAANICPPFIREVLPADPILEREYLSALPDGHPAKPKPQEKEIGKRCATCEVLFQPRSNRQKYCAGCGAENERKRAAERQRRKRYADSLKDYRNRHGLDA